MHWVGCIINKVLSRGVTGVLAVAVVWQSRHEVHIKIRVNDLR
jgi:hypothetical protein